MKELPLPLGRTPGLRTLFLDTPAFVPVPYYNFNEEDASERVPTLRTLEVANCSDLQLPWLEGLRESMKKQGLSAQTLNPCAGLIRSMVKRTKLFSGVRRGNWLLDTGKHDPEDSDMDY